MAQPVTKPVTNENARFRLACFTIFDMTYDFTVLKSKLQFLAYGQEVCPKTGNDHYQCFGYASVAQRWTWWQKLLKPHHFEQCIGTLEQNSKYCAKEGKYQEFGVKPMGDGKKRSLDVLTQEVMEAARGSLPLDEIVTVPDNAPTFVQYHNGISKLYNMTVTNKLRKVDKNFAPEVIYIWGEPGSGKSQKVRELDPDVFDIPEDDGYKWKDGYCGQDAVVYENVSVRNITHPERLLKEIDRYYMQVPVKGGYIGWRPKRIYITTVYPIETFAYEVKFSKPAEFTRRVTQIIHVT